jgi:hypothetical protein
VQTGEKEQGINMPKEPYIRYKMHEFIGKKRKRDKRSIAQQNREDWSWYWEYPLFNHYRLCEAPHQVGWTSKFICQCKDPEKCPGVLKVAETYKLLNDKILEEAIV